MISETRRRSVLCAGSGLLTPGLLLAVATVQAAPSSRPSSPAPSIFSKTGTPFLAKYCQSCHGPTKQKGGLALHEFRDDTAVLRSRRQWKAIIERIQSGEMPPPESKQPPVKERERFLATVNGIFSAANTAPPDPGRLTLRRLNRAEYNNTIRDLLGLDFRPADDFPSDDVGHGFDNIADVLSLSPVLMERYLDAADHIAATAIPQNAARPPKRTMPSRYCEPASPKVPQVQFRPIRGSEKDPVFSGPMNTPARIDADGEYIMRVRLYAKSADGKPVPVALMVTGPNIANPSPLEETAKLDGAATSVTKKGIILKVVEVTAQEEKGAQTFEAKFRDIAGVERIAVAAFKPPIGEATPTLYIEWLEYEGPMDARNPATKALMVFTPGKSVPEQTREILSRFATRAWRRPVTEDELNRLTGLVAYAMGHNDTWEEAMRRAISGILASPKFVFRYEEDEQPENPQAHPVNEYQLATRLSYFLWSSTPDDELMKLAAERQLTANLDAQVKRLLGDRRADAFVDNFGLQWLQLSRLAGHSADAQTYPLWKPDLRAAMLEETRRYFAEIVRSDRSILDLLDGDFTWVNRPLAELYDLKPLSDFKPNEWKRVSLAGTPRGGLLTQASVLTVTSNPTRTSPVKRGKWILEQVLGAPPPPPPPDTPSIDDSNRKELTGTFRQKLEQHRANPACANCHAKMDAYGFALENFNAIGAWRTTDETGAAIDTSGRLTSGPPLSGLADMKALLRDHKDVFARSLTEKMLTYSLGRGLEYYDEPTIERILAGLKKDDYRFSSLVTGIVKSPPFLMRRGTSQQPSVKTEGKNLQAKNNEK